MKRFKNILYVAEPEADFRPALDRAVTLAENNQANLTAVSVMEKITADINTPDGGPVSAELQSVLASSQLKKLEALVEPFRERVAIQTGVLFGMSFLEIVRDVLRNDRDLVIKTPENPDWLTQIFGSDDMHLLRECPCPVWFVKAEALDKYRRILVAVDVEEKDSPAGSNTVHALNMQLLEIASSLALSEFAELHVVHVWNAVGESAMRGGFLNRPEEQVVAYVEQVRRQREQALNVLLQRAVGGLGSDALHYLKPETHLIKGLARNAIPLLAREINADLVVMGTLARTGIPGLIIGNTAETILNQIECSVLAIKPPGFSASVTLGE